MNIHENLGPAILLTLLAGLSTGIGSAIAYFIRRPKIAYLAFSLGLSAGVMIYLSFMELLPKAIRDLSNAGAIIAFFAGIALTAVIDLLVPEVENPHSYQGLDRPDYPPDAARLMRTGIFSAFAIGIHNFPEGMATFAVALGDIKLGLFIAFAIAVHNIPEGIAVSVPIYYATGSRKKAFFYSFLSGLTEPVGAAIGFLVLLPFMNAAVLAALLASVAGVMIYVSLDELLPVAHQYGRGHIVIAGIICGMLVMAVSLIRL